MPATPPPPTRPRVPAETAAGGDDATLVPGRRGSRPQSAEATRVSGSTVAGVGAAAAGEGKKKVARVGGYALIKKLGAGGMGDVYLAKQTKVGRKVALKTLKPDLAKRPDFVARFMREVESMGRLDHPNVVRIYDADTLTLKGKPFAYAAIEYVDGKSMQDWMDERKTLSVSDAVAVTLAVADALRHAHDLNMIHRDIKPDNVLLTRRGVVKVADFGLAKAVDDDQSLTQSGVGMGTPLYMAPEQARNAKHVDARSDIYALGATLYYFLTGDLPFRGESTIALLQAKEAGRFDSARKRNAAVPERLDLVIDKMMARDPDRRYASCDGVIADLSKLNLAGEAVSFVDDPLPVGSGGGATAVRSKPAKPARPARDKPVTSREEAAKQRAAKAAGLRWFVQNPGRPEQRMSTDQILKGLSAGVFDLRTTVKKKPADAFAALAQFPEFESAANALVQKQAADKRRAATGDEFARLAKQQDRRKFWVKLGRLGDGVKGLLSLALLLAALAGAGWAAWTYGWPLIQEQMGEDPAAATAAE